MLATLRWISTGYKSGRGGAPQAAVEGNTRKMREQREEMGRNVNGFG